MKIDIGSIKSKIERQRENVFSAIRRLRREDPFSTTDRSLIVEPATDAAALSGHEQVVILENKLKHDLLEIEKVLAKIKEGTYGTCENCKKKIDDGRLAVKPISIYCVNCEKKMEKARK